MWEVVRVDLWFICAYLVYQHISSRTAQHIAGSRRILTSTHNPLAILTDSHALAGLLELEVLQ